MWSGDAASGTPADSKSFFFSKKKHVTIFEKHNQIMLLLLLELRSNEFCRVQRVIVLTLEDFHFTVLGKLLLHASVSSTKEMFQNKQD